MTNLKHFIINKKNFIKILIIFIFTNCFIDFAYAEHFAYMDSQDEKLKDYFYKGVECANNKEFKKAVELLEEAYKINPKQMQVIGELCYSYAQIEEYQKLLDISSKGLLIAQSLVNNNNIGRFYGYKGYAYKKLGDYKNAAKNLYLSILVNKDFMSNYILLADCYCKLESYEDALVVYGMIQERNPDYYDNNNLENERKKVLDEGSKKDYAVKHIQLGSQYNREKKYNEAIKEYKVVLDKEPESLLCLNEYIKNEVLNNTNKYDEIIKLCLKMISLLDKKNIGYDYEYYLTAYKGIGYCLKKQQNTKLIAEYKKLVESYQLLKAGKEDLQKENFDKAINNFKNAIDKQSSLEGAPYNYTALDDLIYLLMDKKKYDEAKKYISIGLNRAKKDKNQNIFAKYCIDIGLYYVLQEKYEEGIKFYRKAFETTNDKDDKFKSCYRIALNYEILDKNKEALEYYEKAKPFINEKKFELLEDLDSSIIKLKCLLDENSDLSKGNKHFDLGIEYYKAEKYKEAIEEFAKSLKLVPQRLQALLALSNSLINTNRKEEAFEVNNEGYLIAVRDNDVFFIDSFSTKLGNYYMDHKDYDKAINYFKQVSDADENLYKKNIKVLIGICYFLQDKVEDALPYYEAAHEYDPNDETIKEYIRECRKRLNQ